MLSRNKQKHSKKRWLGSGLVAMASIVLLMPGRVFADDPGNCGTDTFFNWGCDGNGIMGLLMTILNVLSIGVALAVVGGIIYGGIIYSTSSGDQGKTQEAVVRIRNAVIALLMYFAMWATLNWLVPGGVFN